MSMIKLTCDPSIFISKDQIKYGEKLGEGGFGEVYKATWNHTVVAVKKLMMELSEKVMQDFNKEVEVHLKLRNPHIVQIFGVTVDKTYGMVMEYMSRGSLRNVLEKNSRETFSWTLRKNIAMDISVGLSYLHERQIIHRDLKSLNVLLDDSYRAKLADFGLAKVRSEISSRLSAQSDHGPKGTPHWMAPEIFASPEPEYTTKTDIFSFGIVMWELATHEYPYKHASSFAVPMLVMNGHRETFPLGTPEMYERLGSLCWHQMPDKRPTIDQAIKCLKLMDFGSSNNQSIFPSSYIPSPKFQNIQQPSSVFNPPTIHNGPQEHLPFWLPPPDNGLMDEGGFMGGGLPPQGLPMGGPQGFPPQGLPQGYPPMGGPQEFYPQPGFSPQYNPIIQPFASLTFNTVPEMAFGKAKWAIYFGDVGIEPPLPPNIEQILNGLCPIWSNKRVRDTHLLTLIPQTINDIPLNLTSLGNLVQKPLQGNATKYSKLDLGEYKDPVATKSYWVLLTRNLIPNSQDQPYANQQKLVQNYSYYQVPNVLDTAVSLFMEHVSTGNNIYGSSATVCQERHTNTRSPPVRKVAGRNGAAVHPQKDSHLVVGCLNLGGLSISAYRGGHVHAGIGGLRLLV